MCVVSVGVCVFVHVRARTSQYVLSSAFSPSFLFKFDTDLPRCEECLRNGDEYTYTSPVKQLTNSEIAFSQTPNPLKKTVIQRPPVARKLTLGMDSDETDNDAVPVKIDSLYRIGALLTPVIRKYSLDKEWKELKKHSIDDGSGSVSFDLKPVYSLIDDEKHDDREEHGNGSSASSLKLAHDMTIKVFPQRPSAMTISMKTLDAFGFDTDAYIGEVEEAVSRERQEKYVALVADPATNLQFTKQQMSLYQLNKGTTAGSFPSYPLLIFSGQNTTESPHFDCSGEGAITTIGHLADQSGNPHIAVSLSHKHTHTHSHTHTHTHTPQHHNTAQRRRHFASSSSPTG